ncbi:T9SS type A sorting domain-containing protein [uncultured Eudoraea sp.]|uniref:T9SS type A sorting domain-containing protein n=1 Tax=uncultured Eudoraea sp. TaxID=1035614 RepID=UPI002614560D|nr:T9SS type A sorting domain-containing protein [uncultured Eudoraea sp.]
MKQFYIVFLFLFISLSYGQEAQHSGGEIEGFELYPNPVTTGKVYIQTTLNAPKRILIFDVFGTQRLETTILRKELNVSDLVAGVYVLRVYEKDKVATRKLIIK